MSETRTLKESMERVMQHYRDHPEKAVGSDKEAIAVIEHGLRVRATGPDGQVLVCDMPAALGGGASAPTPGWCLRAALANCEAVMLAMGAALRGIELKTCEVRVDSVSDDRGMLGSEASSPAGPLNMKISIRLGAQGVPAEALRELAAWAQQHSPVGEPLTRVMPVEHALEIL